MTDHNEHFQFALSDEQLESLATGQVPHGEQQAHLGNPVAQFFADARSSRDRTPVKGPYGELAALFGARPGSQPVSPAQQAPADLGVFSVGSGPQSPSFDEVTLTNATVVAADPYAQADPYPQSGQYPPPQRGPSASGLLSDRTDPGYGSPLLQQQPGPGWDEQTVAGFDAISNGYGEVEQHYDLDVGTDYPGPQAQFAAHAPVYRASPIEAAVNMIRPSGTKALVAATALVFTVTAGQALGVISLPFLGGSDGDQQVAGVGLTTSTLAGPTTTDPSRFGAGALETTTSIDTSTSDTVDGDPDPTADTTAPPATETPTTLPQTTTSEATTTTEAQTTTSQATTTTSTTTTTVPTSATLTIGEKMTVPDQTPAGTYKAANVIPACEIVITDAADVATTVTREANGRIQFTLVDGGSVTAGQGCPTKYELS